MVGEPERVAGDDAMGGYAALFAAAPDWRLRRVVLRGALERVAG